MHIGRLFSRCAVAVASVPAIKRLFKQCLNPIPNLILPPNGTLVNPLPQPYPSTQKSIILNYTFTPIPNLNSPSHCHSRKSSPPMPILPDTANNQPENPPSSSSSSSSSPIQSLPADTLHHIFSLLPLRQSLISLSLSRHFLQTLSSPSFLSLLPPLPLLALRHPRHHNPNPNPSSNFLLAFDPSSSRWIHLPLSFLPFPSLSPITASSSLLYLWASPSPKSPKSLLLCNPLTKSFRPLPPLGSAWSRHATLLASGPLLLLLTDLAALSYSPSSPSWRKFPLNLPSKPRSPLILGTSIYALCDLGNPWRSQWKLFSCPIAALSSPRAWAQLHRHHWGDVFDILKRPRLIRGSGPRHLLMIGGLRSSFAVDAPCSTVLILRLDLECMEWEEAGRMPQEMYRCFAGVGARGAGANSNGSGNNKVKVFGGEGRVWFSGKRVRGKMAMWEEDGEAEKCGGVWKWIDGAPGYGDGVYRGFVFHAAVKEIP